jgi:hypothetical protein
VWINPLTAEFFFASISKETLEREVRESNSSSSFRGLKDYRFKIFILLLKDAHGQIPSSVSVKSKRSGFKYF